MTKKEAVVVEEFIKVAVDYEKVDIDPCDVIKAIELLTKYTKQFLVLLNNEEEKWQYKENQLEK